MCGNRKRTFDSGMLAGCSSGSCEHSGKLGLQFSLWTSLRFKSIQRCSAFCVCCKRNDLVLYCSCFSELLFHSTFFTSPVQYFQEGERIVDDIHELFSQAIRNARLDCKLTQEKLAELADISCRYLIGIEKGEKIPTYGVIRRLVLAIHISADRLFYPDFSEARARLPSESRGMLSCCSPRYSLYPVPNQCPFLVSVNNRVGFPIWVILGCRIYGIFGPCQHIC